eukprot:TRINITY_DN66783_c0_g1_i1.p1 TRINITY_DN66783_c0_g1~~TRINITY_DN66783_c0_g1_i1.p1  ORF type:complete len:374 (-),score=75.64 TRINITY_DN66783_c0_g1_i1:134-1255(-)
MPTARVRKMHAGAESKDEKHLQCQGLRLHGKKAATVRRRKSMIEHARKARRSLAKASLKLCKALSEAAPLQRRLAITDLTQGLRQELIALREAQRSQAPEQPKRSLSETGCRKAQGSTGTLSKAVSASCRPRGNVWCVQTASGCYHRVRLMVSGVVVASRRLASRDSATQGLARLQMAAEAAASQGGGSEAILRAIAAAGARPLDTGSWHGGLGLSYQAVLDARRAVGCRLHTQAVCSVDEALALRREVEAVEARGPAAVAETWRQWTQECRHRRGRCWRLTDDKAQKLLKSREFACGCCVTSRHADRSLRGLQRLVRRAEAALRHVAAATGAVTAAKRHETVAVFTKRQKRESEGSLSDKPQAITLQGSRGS